MKNPWEEITLSDYENHMKSDYVMQLQGLNEMMKGQLADIRNWGNFGMSAYRSVE